MLVLVVVLELLLLELLLLPVGDVVGGWMGTGGRSNDEQNVRTQAGRP